MGAYSGLVAVVVVVAQLFDSRSCVVCECPPPVLRRRRRSRVAGLDGPLLFFETLQRPLAALAYRPELALVVDALRGES